MKHTLKDSQGGCLCGAVRYELTEDPMFIQACHCLDCQRISGSAFVMNMWTEDSNLSLLGEMPASYKAKSGSGNVHEIFYCPHCITDLWSKYYVGLKGSVFVRAGTLDDTRNVKPVVHVFTRSKQQWLTLDEEQKTFEEFYNPFEVWSQESLDRLVALKANQ
ncbi:MAG: aldehyde-activating protein [Gammaproteobacteria bacterium]|nr:aldehyde-activating protein [Gammaproteobacteria bacterium]